MKHRSKNAKHWARIGLLGGCVLATARCGQDTDSNAPGRAGAQNAAGASGAAGSSHNECEGDLPLRFAGRDARVGEACGECNDGHLICGAPNVLVCLGARASQANCDEVPDSGAANPCGGFGDLEFEGRPAAPSDACGACGDGVLICASPTLLSCYGSDDSACASGGAGGADAGAGGALGGRGGTGGSSGGAFAGGSAITGECSGPGYEYLGHSAEEGDPCGACSDGYLVCPGGSSKTLVCIAATPTGYCSNPEAAPNDCGGIGPLLWRGERASTYARCGGCNYGQLACSTGNLLTCSGPTVFSSVVCAQRPEYATCTIPPSAYVALPAQTPPVPLAETKPTVSSFRAMNITVNAIAYNAFDRRLYATVPGSDGPNGNSVAVIDPGAEKVLQYVYVGSEPQALAISDDGKVLWVVNTGSNTLRRVDLATLTTGPLLPLGDTDFGKIGRRLTVVSGSHDSVIVASNGLTIYDNGVPRTMAANTYGLLTSATNSPSLSYGFDNDSTGHDFVTLCINQHGIFAQSRKRDLLSGFGANLLFDGGIVYGSNAAYDIVKQTVVGSYPVADAVAIDPSSRRIFTLRRFGSTELAAYDMDTFAVVAKDSAFPTVYTTRPQLVRWGRYGIAFTDSSELSGPYSLYIGKSTIVP